MNMKKGKINLGEDGTGCSYMQSCEREGSVERRDEEKTAAPDEIKR